MRWGFPRYVPKAEKQARSDKKLAQLKKKRDMRPVIIQGSAIARTWWGKAWNQNLERYADYTNRIGRGRSYVRHGAVLDLQMNAGEIKALVQGSRSKPYEIFIKIEQLGKKNWQQISSSCSGMLDSISELLAGDFPKELGELFFQRDSGLFPSPKEIAFECSCPDWASMCKHVAATLYGVGARLDEDATLFFTLRGVDMADLITRTASVKAENLLEKAAKKSSRIIDDTDLSALFGIELTNIDKPTTTAADTRSVKKTVEVQATQNKAKAKSKSKAKAKAKAKSHISERKKSNTPGNNEKSISMTKAMKKKNAMQIIKKGKRVR
ncbi:MAG TPA: hypothetical protein VEI57_04065 [Nitrospirota bacterium]|nr:hypothetical protein [Nitrospirota bacterium]